MAMSKRNLSEFVEPARQFAEQLLATRRGVKGFDRLAWDACAREGYLRLLMPESWGGIGTDAATATAVFEALGRGGADRGLLFAMGAHVFASCPAIAQYGSAAQREQYSNSLSSGQSVAAFAVTEPTGGSSFSHHDSVAEPTADGYVLTGTKTLVSNAPQAQLFVILVKDTGSGERTQSTAFLVPRDVAGLRVEPLHNTLGMSGSPMGRVVLDRCRLPADALLGRPGMGISVFMHNIRYERTCVLAGLLGAAQRDLVACVEFLTRRTDNCGTLIEHQSVAHRLARMKCRIEVARLMIAEGASQLDSDTDTPSSSAMVKLTVSETLVECAMDTMRLFAGAGWLDEQGVGTALRDVVGTLSASGTSDVLLNTIAAEIANK